MYSMYLIIMELDQLLVRTNDKFLKLTQGFAANPVWMSKCHLESVLDGSFCDSLWSEGFPIFHHEYGMPFCFMKERELDYRIWSKFSRWQTPPGGMVRQHFHCYHFSLKYAAMGDINCVYLQLWERQRLNGDCARNQWRHHNQLISLITVYFVGWLMHGGRGDACSIQSHHQESAAWY